MKFQTLLNLLTINKSIYVSVSKHENFWKISIQDEGMYISPENIEKIFYANKHYTTYGTGKEVGSGLGLMICSEFVEKLDGKFG